MKLEIKKTLVLDGEIVSIDEAKYQLLCAMKDNLQYILYEDSGITIEKIFEEVTLCTNKYKKLFEIVENFEAGQEKIEPICSTCKKESTCKAPHITMKNTICNSYIKKTSSSSELICCKCDRYIPEYDECLLYDTKASAVCSTCTLYTPMD